MKKQVFGELELVRYIRRYFRLGNKMPQPEIGIGDDAAVLRFPPLKPAARVVITVDSMVEGVHFDKKWNWADVGWKLSAINASDIAAMGGVPEYGLLSLHIPKNFPAMRVKQFLAGLRVGMRSVGAGLIGGNMTRSLHGFSADMTFLGTIPAAGRVLTRSGARPGDGIYVTGAPGLSSTARHLMSCGAKAVPKNALMRLIRPAPRIREGVLLGRKESGVTSMIDISDGLLIDLERLCGESGVSAEVNTDALPRDGKVELAARKARVDYESCILAGGEDYELMFTMPDRTGLKLMKTWPRNFTAVTRIGRIHGSTGKTGARVRLEGGAGKTKIPARGTGFVHF